MGNSTNESAGLETIIPQLVDFISSNPEAVIDGEQSVDCSDFWLRYAALRDKAEIAGDRMRAVIFDILAGVCSMMLQANDLNTPFAPLIVSAAGPSPSTSTYRGRQAVALGELANEVANPALKARLADLAWVNTRNYELASLAIDVYIACIEKVRTGHYTMRGGEKETSRPRVLDLLRRACILQSQIGWGQGRTEDLGKIAKEIRRGAIIRKDSPGFIRASYLDLDFKITRAINIAKSSEKLAVAEASLGNNDRAEQLWRLANRAYARSNRDADANRAQIEAAECLVATANRFENGPLYQTHWLEKAIATLRQVRGTNARRAELQARLVRAQGDLGDSMRPISTSTYIGDLVNETKKILGGKTITEALLRYAVQGQSPEPSALRRTAAESIKRSPFGSLFAPIVYDGTFKPVSRLPAGDYAATPSEARLRLQIIQHESLRRGLEVGGAIEPGRLQILFDHAPNERLFTVLAAMSPVVPPHHEAFFGLGFSFFFNANFIAAAHILVPQLENSLRYILQAADINTIRFKSDFTQSSVTLSTMLNPTGEWRKPLESLIGEEVVFEIENLFDHQAGPAIRHRLAHGLLHQWAFGGQDIIYACWFIYRFCLGPLIQHFEQVRRQIET